MTTETAQGPLQFTPPEGYEKVLGIELIDMGFKLCRPDEAMEFGYPDEFPLRRVYQINGADLVKLAQVFGVELHAYTDSRYDSKQDKKVERRHPSDLDVALTTDVGAPLDWQEPKHIQDIYVNLLSYGGVDIILHCWENEEPWTERLTYNGKFMIYWGSEPLLKEHTNENTIG